MPIPGSNFRLFNKRLLTFAALLMALLFIQIACGGGAAEPTPIPDPVDEPDPVATETTVDEPTDEPAGEDEPPSESAREGVFRVVM